MVPTAEPAQVAGVFAGLLTVDLVHRVARHPGADEKITATAQDVAAGGPAANAAVTFAVLGGRATLLTSAGRHPLALSATADLAEHGVRVVDVTPNRTDAPAVSAVRVGPDGGRSVSSPNAEGVAGLDLTGLDDLVTGADVMLADGHLPDLAVRAATVAGAAGVPLLLDAGSRRPVFARLVPLADFVICSTAYAEAGQDPLLDLLEGGASAVAMTRGARSVRWATGDGRGEIPVDAVAAVDTLGAGDAFHGAAAWAVAGLGGATALALWPRVLALAAAVATVRVTHARPRAWLTDPALAVLAASWR